MVFLVGCSSVSPEDYINEALDIMEENSINRHTINWDILRKRVHEEGKDAKNIKDTYPAIKTALKELGDNHSWMMEPGEYDDFNKSDMEIPEVVSKLINNNIGYIRIPGFKGDGEKPAIKFAQVIQDKIKEIDHFEVQYWIIDLSRNTGGYIFPMILGLGPILGSGDLGYLIDADSNLTNWGYSHDGVIFKGDTIMNLPVHYNLKKRIKKIAVLISKETASAGEAITVSFKGNENTIFIGNPTRGVSTGNVGMKLSDDAILFITNTKFVDKTMKVYGDSIIPDIQVPQYETLETAVSWIEDK